VAPSSRSQVVVIGGGVVGCSVAYHLAKRGITDVTILERRKLTHGSTWHAAGLIGQLRGTASLTRLMQTSVRLYQQLEAETGYSTGWRAAGSLRVAASPARWAELLRMAALGASFGLDVEVLTPVEALEKFPLLNTEGLHGAVWVASDGYADPSQLTQSLAAGARALGVRIVQDCRVEEIIRAGSRVTAVRTTDGTVECETLVNATGMWGTETARLAGVDIAVTAVEHQYVVTEKRADVPADLPTLRDPDARMYLKPEGGGLVVGGWEEGTRAPWRTIPRDFGPELFEPDHERFAGLAEATAHRIPMFGELGIQTWVNGPIPFTPDAEPLLGLTPELDNLFHCCGFSAGIAAGGGAGAALANWIVDGDPGLDLSTLDVRRFGPEWCQPEVLAKAAVDSYSSYYSLSDAEGRRA
jgi:4-methylaminobutanoate oxidase (formaldehyde-forming)